MPHLVRVPPLQNRMLRDLNMSRSPFSLGTTEGARRREEAIDDTASDSDDPQCPSHPIRDPEEWAFLPSPTHSPQTRPTTGRRSPQHWHSPATQTGNQPLSQLPPAGWPDSMTRDCTRDPRRVIRRGKRCSKEKAAEGSMTSVFNGRRDGERSPSAASQNSGSSKGMNNTDSSIGSFIELPRYRRTASTAPSYTKNSKTGDSPHNVHSFTFRSYVNRERDAESVTQAITDLRKDMTKLRFGMQRVTERLDRLLDKL